MFTPQKIFFLILILAVIWFLFRVIEKRNGKAAQEKQENKTETVDLTQCAVCGDWVDAACSKPECPIKG